VKTFLLFIFCLVLGSVVTTLIFRHSATDITATPKKTSQATSSESNFSLEKAPSTSLHGDITLLTGDVEWQSRIATEASQITQKQQIQQGESIETGKTGNVSLAFPNMLFELSTDTMLNIIQTLPTSIVLEQPTGKIKYQTTSSTPLSIRTSRILIESRKGSFSVAIDEDDGTVTISVEDGLVTTAYNDTDNFSTVEKIEADQVLTFDPSTRTSSVK